MASVTLRPHGGPARLLLRYWRVVQTGDTVVLRKKKDRSRKRLAELGYLQVLGDCFLTLTPAGQEAARALDACS